MDRRRVRASAGLVVVAAAGGCVRDAYHRELASCRREAPAVADATRRGRPSGGHVAWGWDGAGDAAVTEVRRDCVYAVTVRAGARTYTNGGYAWVGEYAASLDGARVGYVARSPRGWHVVVDGVEGPPYAGTWLGPRFSADGRHVLYVAATGAASASLVVADGVPVLRAERVDAGASGFTSDGRYVIGVRTPDDGVRVVVGGAWGPRYDRTPLSVWTDLRFTLGATGGHYLYVGRREGRWRVVHDGREHDVPRGFACRYPHLSGDGAHWWCRAGPLEPPAPGAAPRNVVLRDGEAHAFADDISEAHHVGAGVLVVLAYARAPAEDAPRVTLHVLGARALGVVPPGATPLDDVRRVLAIGDWRASLREVGRFEDLDLRGGEVVTWRGAPVAEVAPATPR